jgi:hypothetical protein
MLLAIVFSFCAGAAVSLLMLGLMSTHRRKAAREQEAAIREREAALRAELVEHQMRELLGQPQRPYFTAQAVAEARRALDPLVVIKVKP